MLRGVTKRSTNNAGCLRWSHHNQRSICSATRLTVVSAVHILVEHDGLCLICLVCLILVPPCRQPWCSGHRLPWLMTFAEVLRLPHTSPVWAPGEILDLQCWIRPDGIGNVSFPSWRRWLSPLLWKEDAQLLLWKDQSLGCLHRLSPFVVARDLQALSSEFWPVGSGKRSDRLQIHVRCFIYLDALFIAFFVEGWRSLSSLWSSHFKRE